MTVARRKGIGMAREASSRVRTYSPRSMDPAKCKMAEASQ